MADYIITRADGEDLQHFGTKGMRWGERRYQNPDGTLTELGKQRYGSGGERSALGTKHDLNKLDREQTQAKASYDWYHNKHVRGVAKINKRIKKANAKGDTEKVAKLEAKRDKIENTTGKKAEEWKALLDRSKAMTDKIIASAKEKGWSIHSRDTLRAVNRGSTAFANTIGIVGGTAAAALTGTGVIVTTGQYAEGKHYRVKKDGLGIETHRSRRFRQEWNRNMYP